MNNKNFAIVTVILAVVAVAGIISYLPARIDAASKTKVSDFPMVIGDWTAKDIPVDDKTYEILETRNLIVREYNNLKGDKVFLYIVYSEDNRKVSHPPEVCLMGSGITVTDKTSIKVGNSIKASKLLVEKGNNKEFILYWFKAGNLSTDKYLTQQLKIVTDRLFGKRTSGALIRVSCDVKDTPQATMSVMMAFCREIEPLLSKYIP